MLSLWRLFNVTRSEACWNWKNPELPIEETLVARGEMYNGYRVSKGYFGSFCMDGLAMALHSVYHTKSFSEAITKAVNFLGDADSVGAIAGQLAGAIYGFSTFKEYHEPIVQWDDDDISCRAALLYLIGAEKSV
jgi:ADP-ribosylglycohydrolase